MSLVVVKQEKGVTPFALCESKRQHIIFELVAPGRLFKSVDRLSELADMRRKFFTYETDRLLHKHLLIQEALEEGVRNFELINRPFLTNCQRPMRMSGRILVHPVVENHWRPDTLYDERVSHQGSFYS